jgi:hypothetical protein
MPGRAKGWWVRVTLLTSIAVLTGTAARAVTVETLLMPGKVTKAHAKIESECSKCHDRSDRTAQSRLCVDCHKEIGADQRDKRGFHGRMANAGAGECRACHSEHGGRDSDIVQLDTTQFDHRRTDFALEGAHRTLVCASCHKTGEAWSKVATTCGVCHKSRDVHQGQLGQNCADCHNAASWSGARFDHGKTAFALTGAHAERACNSCHVGGHYKGAPKTCIGCHATDDAHRGSRGDNCGNCHTTSDWKTAKYDHKKETGFALLDVHGKLDCSTCHRSGNLKDKLPKDCHGCHRADDSHAGRLGGNCEDCHGNEHWKPADYDHTVRAKFELVGAHAKLGCHVCHSASVATQKLKTDCASCHRALDPHGGRLKGQCDRCHGQDGWRSGIVFDHALSQFPLLGLHAVVACSQCHRTLDFARAETTCAGCHARDDVHKGNLGPKCDDCHSPNGWALWEFDHAKTGFALSGAHRKVQCANCHRRPPDKEKLSSDCASCHQQNDVHAGQFGRNCQRCHTTVTFRGGRAR